MSGLVARPAVPAETHTVQKILLFLIVGAVLLTGCETGVPTAARLQSHDPSRFSYTRLYCTPDNESHFEDVTVDLSKINYAPPASPIYVGGSYPTSSVFFVGSEPLWGAHDLAKGLNHPAPAVQFVTVLVGAFSVTATDGETRRFHVGDVIRTEDIAPCKGHITVVGDKPGFAMLAR
jgi:hypothetical protein